MANIKTGSTTGTGAAINIELGFIPDFVAVFNTTDADQIDFWLTGMTAATSIQVNTAVATRASNGISTYAGSSTTSKGFTIGSGISESGKTLIYLAIENGPGQN
jgi:hypothetical protein